jgi:hypothetical protein
MAGTVRGLEVCIEGLLAKVGWGEDEFEPVMNITPVDVVVGPGDLAFAGIVLGAMEDHDHHRVAVPQGPDDGIADD